MLLLRVKTLSLCAMFFDVVTHAMRFDAVDNKLDTMTSSLCWKVWHPRHVGNRTKEGSESMESWCPHLGKADQFVQMLTFFVARDPLHTAKMRHRFRDPIYV